MTQVTISSKASIDPSAEIGDYCVIEEGVVIGKGSRIGHHVVLRKGSSIADHVQIGDFTVIGTRPMVAAHSVRKAQEHDYQPTQIKSGCLIGSHAVIYQEVSLGERVFVADFASIREKVVVGECSIVGRGVSIENDTTIGCYCKLETNTYITAYSHIEDYCFIAPCVATSNDRFMARSEKRLGKFKGVTMKRGARIGVHATILPGIIFEEDAVAGAGSVVTKNAMKEKIVMGVPARLYKDVDEDQLLINQPPKK